jgi:hypothetical protein
MLEDRFSRTWVIGLELGGTPDAIAAQSDGLESLPRPEAVEERSPAAKEGSKAVTSMLEDRFWEAAARVAVVGGVLLPLAGYGVRWVSLAFSGAPVQLAIAVSPARAATIGLEPFLISIVLVAGIVRWDLFGFRRSVPAGRRPLPSTGWRRWLSIAIRLLILTVVIATFIVIVMVTVRFFLAQPISSVPTLIGILIAAPLLRAVVRGERAVSLRSIGPATVVLVIAAGVSSAIGPAAVLDVSDYDFTDGAAVADGRFATLGDAEGWLYLRSCGDAAGAVVAVPAADVRRITLAPARVRAARASLIEILADGRMPVDDPCSTFE